MTPPTLRLERSLMRARPGLLAAVDEVGRGALAGPVSVGVVVIDSQTPTAPLGLRDSKLLTPMQRQKLLPQLRRWPRAWAVGHAGAEEIDAIGIIAALRLAATRAFGALPVRASIALLDGSHDWLSRPSPTLFDDSDDAAGADCSGSVPAVVVTRVKADLNCAAVAAASVLAKCERDAIMLAHDLAHPGYGWSANKGYGAPEHIRALRELGPCQLHRRSWNLPGQRCAEDADLAWA